MTSQEFIDNLHSHYGDKDKQEYSDLEMKEINNLIYDLSSVQKQGIYDDIRDNYSYRKLPTYWYIKQSVDKIKGNLTINKYSQEVQKKMPQYQLELARDWSIQKILDHIFFLRKKQEQLWKDGFITNDMKTEDLSFLGVWGNLASIKSENLEIAKQRIIEQGWGVNLYDLEPEYKPIKIDKGKKGNQSIKQVMDDIPI